MSLKELQKLSLEDKIALTQDRILQWYHHWDGQVYISFSGGKDSTVLLHLARQILPDIKAVFCDTGLEYPEIKAFVKTIDNVETIRPDMSFKQVIEKHGYPVISKEQSMAINRYRNAKSEDHKRYRITGIKKEGTKGSVGVISKKWRFLIDSPIKISEKCCDILKKNPFKKYDKRTGRKPIIGSMASESVQRALVYRKTGCNAFEVGNPKSTPIAFWLEEDVWEYIKKYDVPYAEIYDKGETRTGCIFCLFGLQKECKNNNRFTRLAKLHPKLHSYCMDKLGLREVIDYINKGGKDDT